MTPLAPFLGELTAVTPAALLGPQQLVTIVVGPRRLAATMDR